jgi:hypothetical protein
MNKSQAQHYLKSMLNGSVPVDLSAALECFRQHYRKNAEKMDILLSESVELTLSRADYGSKCFRINGESISTNLSTKQTDAAKIRVACRTVAREDEPAHIAAARGRDIEIDHQNTGGFAAIVEKFIIQHGQIAVTQAVVKVPGQSRETLSEPIRSAFVELHRQMTNNWSLCAPLHFVEHRRLTRERLGI